MIILLHSSKTMKVPAKWEVQTTIPVFRDVAKEVADYVKTLSVSDIQKAMKISHVVASKTHHMMRQWGDETQLAPAALSFVGDIYSGLQIASLTKDDYQYAQKHLIILSGLYGALRPFDLIEPYRLEMGYRFKDYRYKSMYNFWGERITSLLPKDEIIINTSSVEYSQVVTKYVDHTRIITPQFYTVSPRTGQPTFVTVHSKIARGSFAHWMIKHKPTSIKDLVNFDELGYEYDEILSTQAKPAYVCQEFGGIGLSVRLKDS